MKSIKFTITFTGATGGNVSVHIMGPGTDINYDAKASDPRPDRSYDLLTGAVYSVRVHGLSGGTVNLLVEDGSTQLVKTSCPPSNIFIVKSFSI